MSSSDPVFARLEHHKSHEYRSRRASGTGAGTPRKRRGRPPKDVAGYEITEDEIRARAAVDGPSSAIVHGFVRYTFAEPCPDRRCAYHRHRAEHFHCVRARCHDVEAHRDAIVAHDRNFHSRVRIADGFEFFGADVDCRRAKCRARRGLPGLRHFHCIRPRCDYAFVRQSTMAQHEAKHRMSDDERTSTISRPTSVGRRPVRIVPRPTAAAVAVVPAPPYAVPNVLGEATGTRSASLFTGPSLPSQIVSTNLAAGGAHSLLIAGLPTASTTAATAAVLPSSAGTLPVAAVQGPVSSAAPPNVVVVVAAEAKSELSRPPPSAVLHLPVPTRGTCGRWICSVKQREHLHCGHCDIAFPDVRRLRDHLSCSHGVTADIDAPIDLEPTDLSGNASTSAAKPPSSVSVAQPASASRQLSTVHAENAGLIGAAERYDNDNDNENGRDLAVDLRSPGEGRSSSNVQSGNVND